jgi:hypothetical protein
LEPGRQAQLLIWPNSQALSRKWARETAPIFL